jgi:hypothetical protein
VAAIALAFCAATACGGDSVAPPNEATAGFSALLSGQSGAGTNAAGASAAGAGGANATSAGGRMGGKSGRGAGGAGMVYSSCPPTPDKGAPCSGSFVCGYEETCSACGCCSETIACQNGTTQSIGSTNNCAQPCGVTAGGNGGSGGIGSAGMNGLAGSGTSGMPGHGGSTTTGSLDLFACDAPKPCPKVSEQNGYFLIAPMDAALRCVVQAFHDRTPGIYLDQTSTVDSTGSSTSTFVYLIKADGSVNRVQKSGSLIDSPEVCTPRPPTDYDACLTSVATDTYATTECQTVTWVSSCTGGNVACH